MAASDSPGGRPTCRAPALRHRPFRRMGEPSPRWSCPRCGPGRPRRHRHRTGGGVPGGPHMTRVPPRFVPVRRLPLPGGSPGIHPTGHARATNSSSIRAMNASGMTCSASQTRRNSSTSNRRSPSSRFEVRDDVAGHPEPCGEVLLAQAALAPQLPQEPRERVPLPSWNPLPQGSRHGGSLDGKASFPKIGHARGVMRAPGRSRSWTQAGKRRSQPFPPPASERARGTGQDARRTLPVRGAATLSAGTRSHNDTIRKER